MAHSLNFAFPDLPPAVDTLGASAERLLFVDPDLALVRIRQLLEVFVEHARKHGPTIEPRDEKRLGDVIHALYPAHLRGVEHRALTRISNACNDAVHHRVGHRVTDAFAKTAREQIQAIHAVWTTWLEAPAAFRLPDTGSLLAQAVAERLVALDAIEHQVDVVRASGAVDALGLLPRLPHGVSTKDSALLKLRELSIRRASDNHRGLPPGPADPLALEILRTGDGYARDEAVHYLNRVAVSQLNILAVDQALATLHDLVNWREASATFFADVTGGDAVTDWALGALLGTKGQALAMKAFATRDLAMNGDAERHFVAAHACFDQAGDIDRQDTYRASVLIDRLRIGGSLGSGEQTWLDARIRSTETTGFVSAGGAFRVAVALKAKFLLGHQVNVEAVAQELSANVKDCVSPDGTLHHPYEIVVGWLLQRPQGVPAPLRAAMTATAAAGETNPAKVIPWIARTFLEDAARRPASRPEGPIGAWMDGVTATRALDVLPFYYA